MHPLLQNRDRKDEFHLFMEELEHSGFQAYFRMSVGQFEALFTDASASSVKTRQQKPK